MEHLILSNTEELKKQSEHHRLLTHVTNSNATKTPRVVGISHKGDIMKPRQILVTQTISTANHELLDQLLKKCYIDALTGRFHCRACHNIVHIDWSRNIAYCSIHGMLI